MKKNRNHQLTHIEDLRAGFRYSHKLHDMVLGQGVPPVLDSDVDRQIIACKQKKRESENDRASCSTSYSSFDFVAFVERILEPRPNNKLQSILLVPRFLSSKPVTLLDVLFRLWILSYGFHLKTKYTLRNILRLSWLPSKLMIRSEQYNNLKSPPKRLKSFSRAGKI